MLLIDGVEVKFGVFPNAESNLNFNKVAVSAVSTVTLKFESDQDLFNLFILKSWCDDLFHSKELILKILYMPYSRMDRRNEFYTFNLKYVCNFINAMNFKKVIVYDAHSEVTTALLDRCEDRSSVSILLTALIDDLVAAKKDFEFSAFYPDAGAQKRYGKVAAANPLVGIKSRNFETGAIDKYEVHGTVIPGATVVIIDDLCSKGGTFIAAAKELKKLGAGDIYLIVGHCENNVFAGDLLTDRSGVEKVYTTNSIVGVSGTKMLEIIPIYEVNHVK